MRSSFSGRSADNESWNDIHVALMKDLEKKRNPVEVWNKASQIVDR